MAHTMKAAVRVIEELQEKLKNQDIALAKRLEWIGKVEAQKADLLAALTGLVRDILYGLGPLPKTVPEWHQWEPIIQARAAIERNS